MVCASEEMNSTTLSKPMTTKGFAARYIAAGLAPIVAVIAISASMAANANSYDYRPSCGGYNQSSIGLGCRH